MVFILIKGYGNVTLHAFTIRSLYINWLCYAKLKINMEFIYALNKFNLHA